MNKKSFLNFIKASSLENLLNFAEKRFGELIFEPVYIGNSRLEILQIKDLETYIDKLFNVSSVFSQSSIELPYWAKIWDTSIVLSLIIQRYPAVSKSLLELGCGVGVCGLFAAKHGFKVILSDISEDALLFSYINILKNRLDNRADIEFVDFTNAHLNRKFDIILGSEILYSERSYKPLCKFLTEHISENGEIIIGKEYDIKAEGFFEIAKNFFEIKERKVGLKAKNEKHLVQVYRLVPKF